MHDLERQIEAWADAAATDVDAGAVDANGASSGGFARLSSQPAGGRRRALAAAAVVVALVAGAAGVRALLGDDTQQVVSTQPPTSVDHQSEGPPGEDDGEVLIDVELDATTVAAGEELTGTVTVTNNSSEPIEIGYCGAEFAVGLENDDVDQQMGFDACLEMGEIPPGVSSFDVSVLTTYGSCVGDSPDPGPSGLVACLPEGGVPPLPPGEYRTRLYPPAGLDADAQPVTVTIT